MNIKNNKGFSLLELSIVLIILSMVTVGSIDIATGVLKSAKLKDTKNKLAVIEQAINSYVMENNALPCPAGIKFKNTNSNFGISSCTVNETNGIKLVQGKLIGTVPTKSLKIEAKYMQDGWGDRFVYVVVKDHANVDSDKNEIKHTISSKNLINSTYEYAVISNGENKNGAIRDMDLATVNSSLTGVVTEEKKNIYSAMSSSTNVANSVFDISLNNNETSNYDDLVLVQSRESIIQATQFIDIGCSFVFSETTNIESQTVTKLNNDIKERLTCRFKNDSTKYLTFSTTSLSNAGYMTEQYLAYRNKMYSGTTEEITENISETLKRITTRRCVAECGPYGKFLYYPEETIRIENR